MHGSMFRYRKSYSAVRRCCDRLHSTVRFGAGFKERKSYGRFGAVFRNRKSESAVFINQESYGAVRWGFKMS